MAWVRPRTDKRERMRTAPKGNLLTGWRARESRLISPLQIAVLALLTALILGSYAIPTFGTDLRWALYVYLLMAIAWVAIGIVYRRTVPTPPLGLGKEPAAGTSGELKSMVATLKRADRGMRYSQLMAIHRVRSAFLRKMAALRGLDDEDLQDLLRRPSELRRVVGDPVILDFLEDTSGEGDIFATPRPSDSKLASRFPRGEATTRALGRVVEAMEVWD